MAKCMVLHCRTRCQELTFPLFTNMTKSIENVWVGVLVRCAVPSKHVNANAHAFWDYESVRERIFFQNNFRDSDCDGTLNYCKRKPGKNMSECLRSETVFSLCDSRK